MTDRIPTLVTPIPARENVRARALRLLIEGRVRVRLVHRERVRVDVRGDSGRIHGVTYTHRRWHCTCEATRPGCAHMRAVWLIIAAESL